MINAHGQITFPESNTAGGTYDSAGGCVNGECLWFSQVTTIPGPPTNNAKRFRTYNVDVSSGANDWSRYYPWRAPGTADVRGSGCGVAGGSDVTLFNGGVAPEGFSGGFDAVKLLHKSNKSAQVWFRGETAEVAWGITANHGGGYTWRICPANGVVDENCFQRNILKFANNTQWIQYSEELVAGGPRVGIPRVGVTQGTFPAGSEWTRNPIPACNFCNQAKCGNPLFAPNLTEASGTVQVGKKDVTYYGGQKWIDFVRCGVICAGEDVDETFVNDTASHPPNGQLCFGKTQFPEPIPGLSGFVTNQTFPSQSISSISIVDNVIVPNVKPGPYILSWRWDCEQSPQIWQGCATIKIV